MKTLKRKFKKYQNKKLKKKSKVDIIVKDILRRAYIQDIIETVLYILILSPIIIVLVIKTSLIVQLIIIVLFLSCLYFVFLRSIRKLILEDDQIKIESVFKLRNKSSNIHFSRIYKIELYLTPKGSSGIKFFYNLNGKKKIITINGIGCTSKNKDTLIEFFRTKNKRIIFTGF